MPQSLDKNFYPTLSVFENFDFFDFLFGQNTTESERRIDGLIRSTQQASCPVA